MELAALPVELLDAILAPLAPNASSLAAAALSCAAINPSATRLLYRHLALSEYAHNTSVIRLLATRRDLAGLVRTFSVHLGDADPAARPMYSDLQRALARMTNLTSLALYVDASASWILSPPQAQKSEKSNILHPEPPFYPRLEHLTCNFPLDAHLAAFLGQVPSLISLQLSSFLSDADVHSEPEPAHVHPSHIPLLEAYTGPARVLPALSSRPLRAVHLSGDLTLDLLPPNASAPSAEEAMPHLRQSGAIPDLDQSSRASTSTDADTDTGALLQVLSAMTSAAPAELLETLALAYPNLVCVRLMTTRALWDLPDLAFYSRIADTLSTLPHLTTFELSGMHWQSRRKAEPAAAVETEWISPPVSPRAAELPPPDIDDDEPLDYDFDGAFLDWSY
ncbi:uncharacterized protein TRAVEDRAFT_163902 [Trametes versicolor FP-101664 SS1]|uniref:uncharacterized protein n=1 Tax=Trametes versicolor (strain FP-101664) TaxID=717944 RepID=UPI00046243C0|nr:uncharacterized protein TRAVEDRAFT_163902 [Trametes versicolor FP-101664 SS1]EIW62112.1 hypothetical protein TRAVEDRAFT_163902 [Trametes versicolor FP-101664 SS1]